MRELLVTGEFPPAVGGVGDYTDRLAAALTDRGEDVYVLTSEKPLSSRDAINEDAWWALKADSHVSRSMAHWDIRSWRPFAAFVRHIKPDIVHFQFQAAAFGLQSVVPFGPSSLRTWSIRPLVVTTFHDVLPPHFFPLSGRLGLDRRAPIWMAKGSDAVVVTNRGDQAYLKATGIRTIRYIPIGANILPPPESVDRLLWRQQRGIADDELVLANFGFTNATKGLEDLVQATARLARNGAPIRLLIIGGGTGQSDQTNISTQSKLERFIADFDIRQRVIFTGYESAQTVSADLEAADIVVLPFRDGYSLRRGTLMAALAHGCCIVTTTPQEGLEELPEGAVLTYQSGNIEELIVALQLLSHPSQRAMRKERAREAAQRFTWDQIAREHVLLYWDLCIPPDADRPDPGGNATRIGASG
ncbi:MAG: glycosyltransferase family 4 protein [Chloroflexi bacterium]|nr:glycosyltransferase family 4 protein [Chloroflexota bacterium]